VKKSGDTMTGPLILNADPSSGLGAATKQYADARGAFAPSGNIAATTVQGAIAELDTEKVAKLGDTMTGHLALPTGPAAANAVRKDYVDAADAALAASIPPAPVAATAAEYLANSAPTKMLTPGAAWAAAACLSLTDGATVTPDFNAACDFILSIAGTGRTFANPVNPKVGQKGIIYIQQAGSGNNTITTWGSAWKFPGGVKPVLSTAVGQIDAISYSYLNSNYILCTFSAGFA